LVWAIDGKTGLQNKKGADGHRKVYLYMRAWRKEKTQALRNGSTFKGKRADLKREAAEEA